MQGFILDDVLELAVPAMDCPDSKCPCHIAGLAEVVVQRKAAYRVRNPFSVVPS